MPATSRGATPDRYAVGRDRRLLPPWTGCPWRCLRTGGLPPRSTVNSIFRTFQRDGTWDAIWAELRMVLGGLEGREIRALDDPNGQSMRVAGCSAGIRDPVQGGVGSRQDPQPVSVARTGLNRRRVQCPSGEGRRRAEPAHGDREADRRHDGLRRRARPQGGPAHLLVVRTQSPTGQELEGPRRDAACLGGAGHDPTHRLAARSQVGFWARHESPSSYRYFSTINYISVCPLL